jgi:hypothetical protein
MNPFSHSPLYGRRHLRALGKATGQALDGCRRIRSKGAWNRVSSPCRPRWPDSPNVGRLPEDRSAAINVHADELRSIRRASAHPPSGEAQLPSAGHLAPQPLCAPLNEDPPDVTPAGREDAAKIIETDALVSGHRIHWERLPSRLRRLHNVDVTPEAQMAAPRRSTRAVPLDTGRRRCRSWSRLVHCRCRASPISFPSKGSNDKV